MHLRLRPPFHHIVPRPFVVPAFLSVLSRLSSLLYLKIYLREDLSTYLFVYIFSAMHFCLLPPLHLITPKTHFFTSHPFGPHLFLHQYFTSSSIHQDIYLNTSLPFTNHAYSISTQLPTSPFTSNIPLPSPTTTLHISFAVSPIGLLRE